LPHKLHVTLKVVKFSPYKKFLKNKESVNGVTTRFILKLKNLNNEKFPGGKILLSFEISYGMETMVASLPEIELPALAPEETFDRKGSIVFVTPGIWKAVLEIKPNSGKVLYCIEGISEKQDTCVIPIYVENRIQIELLRNLKKALQEKEE
jgi:hypothetical protein